MLMSAGNVSGIRRAALTVVAAACVAACLPGTASADTAVPLVPGATVPWHASLADARQAARVSRRPVLVVFTAATAESGAALARDVFPASETVALLTACFEPVCIDVDADPSSARTFGITTIPTACILDGQDHLLAKFDCPVEPAAFVAAVSRASQDAAVAQSAGGVRPAAVVRAQSDFVSQAASQSQAAAPAQAATQIQPAATAVAAPPEQLHAEEPALPASPPAWPAEPAARPMAFGTGSVAAHAANQPQAAARPALEPAPPLPPAQARTAPAAWLDPTAAAQPNAAPQIAATAPATPAAQVPAATPAAEEKPSASDAFLAALKKPFAIFTKPKPAEQQASTATPAPQPSATPPAAEQPAAATVAATPGESMPLGLEGYCPVSLVDKGTWVEGRAQWGARHRGRTYLFAGAEQQRAFLTDPDRYAPALSGDDPVLACDSGRQVAGQRRYGVTYQARTYLFSSPETRAAFAADPQRYTTRVMIAERPTAPGTIVR